MRMHTHTHTHTHPLQTSTSLFFGFMGSAIFLGVGPLLAILALAGVGLGSVSGRAFGLMVGKGLLDNVLSDYLWARAILLVGEWGGSSCASRSVCMGV